MIECQDDQKMTKPLSAHMGAKQSLMLLDNKRVKLVASLIYVLLLIRGFLIHDSSFINHSNYVISTFWNNPYTFRRSITRYG